MSDYTNDDIPYLPHRPSELKGELLGSSAHNPFAGYNSSPRQAMFTKHLGQALVVSNPEVRRLQTGTERELGKYTHKIGFDYHSYIVKVIPKFPYVMGKNNVEHSPMRAIIFENREDENFELDILYDVDHFSMHNFFGFQYKPNEDVTDKIRSGARIAAGTIIADSPNVQESGDYAYGVNANVVMCSHPGGTEDGVVLSESFAKRLTTRLYEKRKFSFGNGVIPLNMYGNDKVYKVFPDIGDKVRADGILCSLREYIPELAPCDLSVSALQQVTQFDKSQYVEPNATVVDVTVTKGQKKSGDLFSGQDEQVTKYHERRMEFYKELTAVYRESKRARGDSITTSHELQRLLVEAHAFTTDSRKLQEKRQDLQPWTVEVTVMYELPAENGFKITDTHGGKSVTVAIEPDENMPKDKKGNVTDIIVNDVSIINRLIKGKPYEHYIQASMRDFSTDIAERVKAFKGRVPVAEYKKIFHELLGMYKIISPPFYKKIQEIKPNIKEHVEAVAERGIYIWVPTDNPVGYLDVVKLLEEHYPPCYDQVTFMNEMGEIVTTANKILIGQIYYILLEKIGNDPSAVTSAKLQHYGLPSKPSAGTRYDAPHKRTPVRFGESEMRLFAAFAGGREVADIVDRSTNIPVHEHVLQELLAAEYPTNIDSLVDRKLYPIGDGHIQRVIKHEFECMGLKYVRGDEEVKL